MSSGSYTCRITSCDIITSTFVSGVSFIGKCIYCFTKKVSPCLINCFNFSNIIGSLFTSLLSKP